MVRHLAASAAGGVRLVVSPSERGGTLSLLVSKKVGGIELKRRVSRACYVLDKRTFPPILLHRKRRACPGILSNINRTRIRALSQGRTGAGWFLLQFQPQPPEPITRHVQRHIVERPATPSLRHAKRFASIKPAIPSSIYPSVQTIVINKPASRHGKRTIVA